MNAKSVKVRQGLFIRAVFISSALLIMALNGCVSTESGKVAPGPGSPDEIQMKHYEMVVSADRFGKGRGCRRIGPSHRCIGESSGGEILGGHL